MNEHILPCAHGAFRGIEVACGYPLELLRCFQWKYTMRNICLALLCVVFVGGCSSLPMNIPINPNLPDLNRVPSQNAQRTRFSAVHDSDRAKRHIGDVSFDRQGLADVLSVAPTQ